MLGSCNLVKLKGRRSVRGKIKGFDKQMNIVITEAVEILEQPANNNSPEKGKDQESQVGDALIRGDNVIKDCNFIEHIVQIRCLFSMLNL